MLRKDTVEQYTARLASGAPIPGGGSASALVAALGMALGSMVANLTVKKVEGEEAAAIKDILEEGEILQEKLLELVDADAEAFSGVSRVFKMPRETEEEKAARREAMQKALKEAAVVPMEAARLCLKALHLQERLLELGTPHAISDVGVGALFLGAALRGAYLNVQINLNGIKDEEHNARLEGELLALLAEGEKLAEEIYRQVEGKLNPRKGAGE
ncbi:MAG: cyclodeaminase/cyclohydrolase family protein [bacterium]|nr:cyclodeaminase/cyclohydrolase family protein [Bacillota bacterium]HHW54637.1 cyclodeaminase/cyclohydrolase family protein [Bacillota bacterium]